MARLQILTLLAVPVGLSGVLAPGCASDGGPTADQGVVGDLGADAGSDSGSDASLNDLGTDEGVDAAIDGLGSPPATFDSHNVLLEHFTGAWAGFAPDGYAVLETVEANAANRLVAVAVHVSDAFESVASAARTNYYADVAYPQAAIDGNRPVISRNLWDDAVQTALLRDSRCGLAIDARLTRVVEVQAACESGTQGEARLVIWAVEAEATGPSQANYLNAVAGHRYEGAGDPIVGFEYTNVMRGALTSGAEGEVIDLGASPVSRTVDVRSACTDTDCMVVAFLTVFDVASGHQHVEAVERVDYGSLLPW